MPKYPSSPRHPRKHQPKSGKGNKSVDPPAPQPVFAQPVPSPDPSGFKNPVTDQSLAELATLEPVLTLAQVYGSAGAAMSAAITASGQIVFHSVGDTGSVEGPSTQSLVADKMVADFTEEDPAD